MELTLKEEEIKSQAIGFRAMLSIGGIVLSERESFITYQISRLYEEYRNAVEKDGIDVDFIQAATALAEMYL